MSCVVKSKGSGEGGLFRVNYNIFQTHIFFHPNLLHPITDLQPPVVLHFMKLVGNVWKIGMSDLIQPVDDCLEVGPLMTVKPPAIYERE